jgi:hypothetical protein
MEMVAHLAVGHHGDARKVRPGLHQLGKLGFFGLLKETPLLNGAAGDVNGITSGVWKYAQASLFEALASPDAGDITGIGSGFHGSAPVDGFVQEDPDHRAFISINPPKFFYSDFFFKKMHLLHFCKDLNATGAHRMGLQHLLLIHI